MEKLNYSSGESKRKTADRYESRNGERVAAHQLNIPHLMPTPSTIPMTDKSTSLPHSTTKTLRYGAPPSSATHAVILLHGRGGAPPSIVIPLAATFLFPPPNPNSVSSPPPPKTESGIPAASPAAGRRMSHGSMRRWSELSGRFRASRGRGFRGRGL